MTMICTGSNVEVGPRSIAASTAGALSADHGAAVAAGLVLWQEG